MSWSTVVLGDPKVCFSIATTPKCREGRYSFPSIASLILDPYFIVLSLNKQASSKIFLVLGMIRPRIEPRSLGPLANTSN